MEIVAVNKKSSYSCFDYDDSLFCGYSKRTYGGYSSSGYKSLNLGLNTDDSFENVKNNRKLFFDDLGYDSKDVCYVNQTHSSIVHNCDFDSFKSGIDGDGLFTTQVNKLLTVTTADCGNVVLFSKTLHAIAVIHCGWKSVNDSIIHNAIKLFNNYSGGKCNDIVAFMGPMIRGESYEVSKEFQSDYFPNADEFFEVSQNRFCFHLDRYIKNQLIKESVKKIYDCEIDTYKNSDTFYSYRKDKKTGRIVTFATLK